MIVHLLEYETCNGEYGETRYKQVYSSEEKAKAAFDKLLDPELLKGEDAINEWRVDEDDPDVQRFRTGNWGYCVWTITKMTVDHVGEVHFWEAKWELEPEDDNVGSASRLATAPGLNPDELNSLEGSTPSASAMDGEPDKRAGTGSNPVGA